MVWTSGSAGAGGIFLRVIRCSEGQVQVDQEMCSVGGYPIAVVDKNFLPGSGLEEAACSKTSEVFPPRALLLHGQSMLQLLRRNNSSRLLVHSARTQRGVTHTAFTIKRYRRSEWGPYGYYWVLLGFLDSRSRQGRVVESFGSDDGAIAEGRMDWFWYWRRGDIVFVDVVASISARAIYRSSMTVENERIRPVAGLEGL